MTIQDLSTSKLIIIRWQTWTECSESKKSWPSKFRRENEFVILPNE